MDVRSGSKTEIVFSACSELSHLRAIFRQNVHAFDGFFHDALDDDSDMPAIPSADNRCRVFILHKDVDSIIVHVAANKTEKQSIISLCSQSKVEPRFDSLLLGFLGEHCDPLF